MGRTVRKKVFSRALPGRHDAAEPAPDACAARCADAPSLVGSPCARSGLSVPPRLLLLLLPSLLTVHCGLLLPWR